MKDDKKPRSRPQRPRVRSSSYLELIAAPPIDEAPTLKVKVILPEQRDADRDD
jgi:hypothetical protein